MPPASKGSVRQAEPALEQTRQNLTIVKRSRPRVHGSKNLRKHELQVIHQHLQNRVRKQKDTEFVVDGVVQNYHNVIRKIGRALGGNSPPSTDNLPPLPPRIILKTPPPGNSLGPLPQSISTSQVLTRHEGPELQFSELVQVESNLAFAVGETPTNNLGHLRENNAPNFTLSTACSLCAAHGTHNVVYSLLNQTCILGRSTIWKKLSGCHCGHALLLLAQQHSDRLFKGWASLWSEFLFCLEDLDSQNVVHMEILKMFLLQGGNVDESFKDCPRMSSQNHGISIGLYESFEKNNMDCWPTILDYFFYYDRAIFEAMAPFSKRSDPPEMTRPGILKALKEGTRSLQYVRKALLDPNLPKLQLFLQLLLWEQLVLGSPNTKITSTYKIDTNLVKQLFDLSGIRIADFSALDSVSLLLFTVRSVPPKGGLEERVNRLRMLFDKRVYMRAFPLGDAQKSPYKIVEVLPIEAVTCWDAMERAVRANVFGAVHELLKAGFDLDTNVRVAMRDISMPGSHRHLSALASIFTQRSQTDDPSLQGCATYDMMKYLIDRGARLDVLGGQPSSCPLEFLRFVLWEDPPDLLRRVVYLAGRIDDFNNACFYCSRYLLEESLVSRCYLQSCRFDERIKVFKFLLSKGIRRMSGSPLSILIQMDTSLSTRTARKKNPAWFCRSDINRYCRDYSSRRCQSQSPSSVRYTSLTPLQAAASKVDKQLVHYLLQRGALVNAPARGNGGRTAMQAICEVPHSDRPEINQSRLRIVELLLGAGADVNAKPARSNGCTALTAAIRQGHLNIVKLLIERGADVNARPSRHHKYTALAEAVGAAHINIVELLVASGADVNAPTGITGKLAFDIASGLGLFPIVNILWRMGAMSYEGALAGYHRALGSKKKHHDVIDFLQGLANQPRGGPSVNDPVPRRNNHVYDPQKHDKVENGALTDSDLDEEEMELIRYNRTQDMIMGYDVEGEVEDVIHGPIVFKTKIVQRLEKQ